jgi:hypothetical protein
LPDAGLRRTYGRAEGSTVSLVTPPESYPLGLTMFSTVSGDLFGNEQTRVMRAVEGSADSLGRLLGREQSTDLYHPSFALSYSRRESLRSLGPPNLCALPKPTSL